jgi:hypothetical protein
MCPTRLPPAIILEPEKNGIPISGATATCATSQGASPHTAPRTGAGPGSSTGVTPEALGLSDDLHLVTLEPSAEGTLVTWDSSYEAADLGMMKAHMHEALSNIGENLLKRFGGRLVHCYSAE